MKPSITIKLVPILFFLTSCRGPAATEQELHKSFDVAPGGSLVVDVDSGSLDITTAAGDKVTVNVWRKITRKTEADERKFLRDHPMEITRSGNTITVRCRDKEPTRHWFSWVWHADRNEVKYTISLPARFNADLKTSGGSIAVSNVAGTVKARTSGGNLKFTRVQGPLNGNTSGGNVNVAECKGTIRIHTSGGGITVTGGGGLLDGKTSGGHVTVKQFAGPASVTTSGGGMTIENVGGNINARTSGGHINAKLISPIPGTVTLSTSGGGVTVDVPGNAAFDLDARSSGGGVHCDLPITIQGTKKHGALSGSVNGGGPAVVLRSSGGGIHVNKL